MKMISNRAFAVGLALSIAAVQPLCAQSYQGDIDIAPLQLEQAGDSLYLDMEVNLSNVKVNSRMSIDLAPKLISEVWSTDLPVVSVKGRRNYNAYRRGLALEKKASGPVAGHGGNIVLKGYGPADTLLRYTYTLPYESWMADAVLNLWQSDSGCGESRLAGISTIMDSVVREMPLLIPAPMPAPVLAFARPRAEEVKSREIQAEVRLDFIVNKTDIDPSYMGNMRELLKIGSIIDELKNDPSISIVGLEIVGYASPEGSLANNKRLSEGRAMALRDYLMSLYDFPTGIYKITFGGENWNGLVDALADTDMDYKDQVLDIIAGVPAETERKSRIMALRGGAPYRYMLSAIYPGLRTAICKIDYQIKGFEAEDVLGIFRTRPQNLSLNEFYMASGLLDDNSAEFAEVFETAVRMYPDDVTANLNAAVAALKHENTEAAERYLDKITGVPEANPGEYYNAMGVLAWLKGDPDSAADYFEKGAEAGLEEAAANLREINRVKPQ